MIVNFSYLFIFLKIKIEFRAHMIMNFPEEQHSKNKILPYWCIKALGDRHNTVLCCCYCCLNTIYAVPATMLELADLVIICSFFFSFLKTLPSATVQIKTISSVICLFTFKRQRQRQDLNTQCLHTGAYTGYYPEGRGLRFNKYLTRAYRRHFFLGGGDLKL